MTMIRDEAITLLNDWSKESYIVKDNLVRFRRPVQKKVFRGAIEVYNNTSIDILSLGTYTQFLKDGILKLFSDVPENQPIFSVDIYSIGRKYYYLCVCIDGGIRYLWDD